MAENTKIRQKVVAKAIVIFILAMLAYIVLWYFILINGPSLIRTIIEVTQTGRSPSGTVELLKLSDQLSVVVMRWGIIPIFIGGIGDLTLYYVGYAAVVAAILTIWVKRRR